MRLVLPVARFPDVAITWGELQPMPFDLERWRREVVGTAVRVGSVERLETKVGWPVVLVRSELCDGTARIHAFYELFDRACHVAVEGAGIEAVEATRDHLLAADVDWHTDELVAISQLWEPS